ncbi:hypothetical protein [Tenacibaculum halocynthiae]|uniref:hypothetical protein n=1 Tax=Tenacibaculum halocynthiae TaxID=1254437 RepID=UPI003D64B738
MSKRKAIKILNQVRDHYINTLVIDNTDKENLKEIEDALQWVKSQKTVIIITKERNHYSSFLYLNLICEHTFPIAVSWTKT